MSAIKNRGNASVKSPIGRGTITSKLSIRDVLQNVKDFDGNPYVDANGRINLEAQNTQLYEITAQKKKLPTRSAGPSPSRLATSTISIRDMLRDVKDVDGKPYINADGSGNFGYNQSVNEGNRGSIYWDMEGKAIVQLFQAKDASTFIHEATGHYFANILAQEAAKPDATPQVVKDFETMLKYAKTSRERWDYLNSKPRQALTEQEDAELVKIHETWATAAEQYILEGKAPSRELQTTFNRFKKWMLDIYKSLQSFLDNSKYAVPITDEVRQVFDRMLASEQQIAEMEKLNGYYANLPKMFTDQLSDKYKNLLYNAMAKAHDKAVNILSAKSLENFTAERKKAIKEYRAEIRPWVEEQVDAEPLYVASRQLLENGSVTDYSSQIKALVNNFESADLDRVAQTTTLDRGLLGKTKEELFNIALEDVQKKNGKRIKDPRGEEIYFAPGNTETLEGYTLHLIAGQGKSFEDIRLQRVLGLLLAEETIKNPLAIVRQNNGRKMYLAVYKGANNMTNGLVIGVEEGQNGRVVTSTLTADKKGDKKAALREFKKRISGADEVLYNWEGLTGRPRPSSDQQASQSDAELRLSGNNILSQNEAGSNRYKDVKALVNHYYDLVDRSQMIDGKPLSEAEEVEVMTFDMIAESNGFTSGDELAKAILENPTRQQAQISIHALLAECDKCRIKCRGICGQTL